MGGGGEPSNVTSDGVLDQTRTTNPVLTEFGASANVSDGELEIEGYSLYRGNHSSGGGGLGKGAAFYVKDTLYHSACTDFDNVAFDITTICSKSGGGRQPQMLIIC